LRKITKKKLWEEDPQLFNRKRVKGPRHKKHQNLKERVKIHRNDPLDGHLGVGPREAVPARERIQKLARGP